MALSGNDQVKAASNLYSIREFLGANLDYAFTSSDTGDEYRMELFDSALQYAYI